MTFTRLPATNVKTPKNCPVCPKRGVDRKTWEGMFASAREALAVNVTGIVAIKAGRAWFQIVGDATPYSVMLSDTELAMFHL